MATTPEECIDPYRTDLPPTFENAQKWPYWVFHLLPSDDKAVGYEPDRGGADRRGHKDILVPMAVEFCTSLGVAGERAKVLAEENAGGIYVVLTMEKAFQTEMIVSELFSTRRSNA